MLDIQNLSVTFNAGSIDEKNVLHDLNLHVETGEFICIIGSNGAGKSTILNTIAGSIIPEKGKILLMILISLMSKSINEQVILDDYFKTH